MTTDGEKLGQRLRRLRESLGLSQEDLADKAGVPLVSYRNWEYDHRLPGLGAASLLAKSLGVPLQDLADCVEGIEDRRSQPRQGRDADRAAASATAPRGRPKKVASSAENGERNKAEASKDRKNATGAK